MAFASLWYADDIHRIADDWLSASQGDASPPRIDAGATDAFRAATLASVPPKFSFEQTWSGSEFAWAVATGDFNGDGRDDLSALAATAPGYGTEPKVHLYIQQPNGTLGAPVLIPFPVALYSPSVIGMVAADFNEDGIDDIAVSQSQYPGLFYLVSQPGGGFAWRVDHWSTEHPAAPAHTADMDGDGHLDVVMQLALRNWNIPTDYPGQVVTYFGDGAGNFDRHHSETSTEFPRSSAMGDLNNDGRPDFFSTPWLSLDMRPVYRRNDAQGGWLSPIRMGQRNNDYYSGPAIADMTGDGLPDALVTNIAGLPRLMIYPQLANGSLATRPSLFHAATYSSDTALADLNGDGRTDFLQLGESSYGPTLFYYLPDVYGVGYSREFKLFVPDPDLQFIGTDLAVGDFNHDGINDVAVASQTHPMVLLSGKLTLFGGAGGLPGAPVVTQVQEVSPMAGALRTVDVTVGPPVDAGGNPITGYTVFAIPGGSRDSDEGSATSVHQIHLLDENESYVFYARATNAAGMGPASALSSPLVVGTPVDPDSPPVLSFDEFESIKECDVGPRTVEIRGRLSKPAPPGGARFDVATSDGSAKAGIDYVASFQGDVFIPEDELLTPPIFITVLGDQLLEGNEDLHLVLSDLQGITVVNPTPSIEIYDDDSAQPTIGLNIPTVFEGDAGDKIVMLAVQISQVMPNDVTFDLGTGGDRAEAGVDYEPLHLGGLRIPAGQTSLQVPMIVHGDTVFEETEYVGIALNNFQGGVIDGTSDISLTIVNDDPVPTLSIADVVVEEGSQGKSYAKFRASLTARMPYGVSFSAFTKDGTAKGGSDFVSSYQGGIIIPAGQPWVDVTVALMPDTRFEPNETFSIKLESPTGMAITDDTAVATVVNDDVPNGIAIDDLTVGEGGVAQFTVRLSEPSASPVTFDVGTSYGTAIPGVDFEAKQANNLLIPAGSLSATFSVATFQDDLVEDNETFVVNLSNVIGATVSDAQGLARIINDDVATLSVGDASIVEGNDGETTLVFEVRLSQPMPTPVTFHAYTEENGSATWGADYVGFWTPEMTIDAGRTRQIYQVQVLADTDAEPDETFLVKVGNVTGAVLADDTGVGTIINDDGAGVRAGRGSAKAKAKILSAKPRH